MFFFLVLFLASFGEAWYGDDGAPCHDDDDCPVAKCYTVDCLRRTNCTYTRIPVASCCLTDQECCDIAPAEHTGFCNSQNQCAFCEKSPRQCTLDEQCAETVSGRRCSAQGRCFLPECAEGWCVCSDTSNEDLDGDGVACADDCDDTNAAVSRLITCVRDRDDDGYPSCSDDYKHYGDDSSLSESDDAVAKRLYISSSSSSSSTTSSTTSATTETGVGRRNCRKFCVGVRETCPHGWLDLDDPHADKKRRSTARRGLPCSTDQVPRVPERTCDCCDSDRLTYPRSPYASDDANLCGSYDYNCDGHVDAVACCENGRPSSSGDDARILWLSDTCVRDVAECGGCSGSGDLVVGWSCEASCADLPASHTAADSCPDTCEGECVCVDEKTSPRVGQCAKLIDDCLLIDQNSLYSDSTSCCIAAAH